MGDSTAYPGTVSLAQAIARAEGGLTPGTAPYRTNNPCDVFVGGSTAGYPTMAAGWDACYSQINLMNSGGSAYYTPDMTISEVGAVYAPASVPGNSTWAANVAAALGVPPSTTLAQIAARDGGGAPAAIADTSGGDSSGYDLSSILGSTGDGSSSIDPLLLGGAAVLVIGLIAWAA